MATTFIDKARMTVRAGTRRLRCRRLPPGKICGRRRPVPAVTAVRAAGGHIFFPVEGNGTVAAVAGADGDARLVNECCCHCMPLDRLSVEIFYPILFIVSKSTGKVKQNRIKAGKDGRLFRIQILSM